MSLEDKINQINQKRLPRHVAIIMDGNGRWARQRNLDRSMGPHGRRQYGPENHRDCLRHWREVSDTLYLFH